MKINKISVIAPLAISTLFAGGGIVPPKVTIIEETKTEMVVEKKTTVDGQFMGYYYTTSIANNDMFAAKSSQLGFGATLNVSHTLFEGVTANFSALGYVNSMNSDDFFILGGKYYEGQDKGAIFNIANITATFEDTTIVLGRQLLETPMLTSYDWFLARGSYEAYTVMNKSIEDLTLVGSYVTKYRANNSGAFGGNLQDNNYALGAVYGNKDIADINLWFYNLDALDYTQVYADISKEMMGLTLSAQVIQTSYDSKDANGEDTSIAYGVKLAYSLMGIDLSGAYNDISDRTLMYIDAPATYTGSWNNFTGDAELGSSWKVEAGTEFMGVNGTISYADYEVIGEEFDAIGSYDLTKDISLNAIYTATKQFENGNFINTFEMYGTYKF